jgi:SpoVK/Ycf46/Vps4 family AAA+-type ATPase
LGLAGPADALEIQGIAAMTREEMEAKLLRKPFDQRLRTAYAELLLESGESEAADEQFELLSEAGDSAQPWVGRALAALARGEREPARAHYQRAREFADFEQLPELEALEPPRPSGRPRLAIVNAQGDLEAIAPSEKTRTRFADVAGLDALKQTLRMQIIEPFLRPGLFARFRKNAGGGVLLYGPPGCGKTLIARAVAGEIQGEFISVGVSEIVSMWFGESESLLARLFDKARAHKPCVLFFDELDALAFSRSKAQSEHSRRIVNEFLSQLDGISSDNQQVLVLAATNMPWDVDPAMKRSGRFARQVFVPPPDAAARAALFELKLADVPTTGIDTARLAASCELFSGADIEGLIDLAKEVLLGEIIRGAPERPLAQAELLAARKQFQPTTLDWLRTARNLVRYGGSDSSYRDVEQFLKSVSLP